MASPQCPADRLTVFRRNDQAATGAAEVDEYAVTSMADSVAALVAAHGVLFGNVDQAPRRFDIGHTRQHWQRGGTDCLSADAEAALLQSFEDSWSSASDINGPFILSLRAGGMQALPNMRVAVSCRRFMQMRAPVLYIAQRGLTANSAQMAAVAELMCTTGSLSG